MSNDLIINARVTHEEFGRGMSLISKDMKTMTKGASALKSSTNNMLSAVNMTGSAAGFGSIIGQLHGVTSAFLAVQSQASKTKGALSSLAMGAAAGLATAAVMVVGSIFQSINERMAEYKREMDEMSKVSDKVLDKVHKGPQTELGKQFIQDWKDAYKERDEATKKLQSAQGSPWSFQADIDKWENTVNSASRRVNRLETLIKQQGAIAALTEAQDEMNKEAAKSAKLKADQAERELKTLQQIDGIMSKGVQTDVRRFDFTVPNMQGISDDLIKVQRDNLAEARKQSSLLQSIANKSSVSLPL